MNLKIPLTASIKGAVVLPASKSYSIRAHFVAACGGRSRIVGASDCDDAKVARTVAQQLSRGACAHTFDVGESGTSLRFLLPLLPYFSTMAKVTGRGTLVGRPNHHLCAALRAHGLDIKGSGVKESVPITFKGGKVPCGCVKIDGSLSSQFISALMIAAPLSGGDMRLVMTGKTLVSQDYVTMTRQILARAGIRVLVRGKREFFIPGAQTFKGLKDFHVPSDYGLAAFFMAAAALVPSDVTLKGYFDDRLVQSDGAILRFLKHMGVKMVRTSTAIRIKGPFDFKGGTFSLRDCPDLVPIMAVMAMFAKGVTRLKDIGHARVKESDRISDLRRELQKVGADIEEKPDELIIRGQGNFPSPLWGGVRGGGIVLDPHHDHRLAMAFAVLGLKVGITVKDVECTSKSYPGFVKDFKKILAKKKQ
jgi:3-phosphoshikimate 1-carboxyvinyltransferase